MNDSSPQELDVVRVLVDVPEFGLVRGQKGTVLFAAPDDEDVCFVEFADEEGVELASVPLLLGQLEVVWSHAEHSSAGVPLAQDKRSERARISFQQGLILLRNGLSDQAKAKFRSSFEIEPKYAGQLTNYAAPLAERERWLEAISIHELVLSLQPLRQSARDNLAITYLNWGVHLGRQRQYADALNCFRDALLVESSEEISQQVRHNILAAHNNQAVELALAGKFDEALHEFNLALELSPGMIRKNCAILAGVREATIEITQPEGRDSSSEKTFEIAIRAGLEPTSIHVARGAAFANLGQWKAAETAFRNALEIDPQNEHAHRNMTLLNQCRADAGKGLLSPSFEIPFRMSEFRAAQRMAA